jgi:preprotein translocase subunit SecD
MSLNAPQPLTPAATLEVFAASPNSTAGSRQVSDPNTGTPIFLMLPPIVTAADVATVSRLDEYGGNASLTVQLTPVGGAKMTAATTPANGQQVAVVVNGKAVGVMKVHAPIGAAFVVAGGDIQKNREAIFSALTGR